MEQLLRRSSECSTKSTRVCAGNRGKAYQHEGVCVCFPSFQSVAVLVVVVAVAVVQNLTKNL